MASRGQRGQAATAESAVGEGAATGTRPADLRIIRINCGECGQRVDAVEWDANWTDEPTVTAAASVMGVDAATARKLLGDTRPEALQSSQRNAQALAEKIVAKTVPDRDAETYVCPAGHDGTLEIAA